MKHWLRQYEALAFARMKRSTFFVPNVPKARFIAEGDFIFHAPSGVLHSAKTERQALPVFLFWLRYGIGFCGARIFVRLRWSLRRKNPTAATQPTRCIRPRRRSYMPQKFVPHFRGPHRLPPRLPLQVQIPSEQNKRAIDDGSFILAEKEGFEPSRQLPDLHP